MSSNYEYKWNHRITGDDKEAVAEEIKQKIEFIKQKHARSKELNAYWRKHKTLKGCPGITDEKAEQLDHTINNSLYKVPVPTYQLQYNLAEIKRLESRLASMKKVKQSVEDTSDDKYPKVDGCEVIENIDLDRIQLVFDDVPSAEVRTLLKRYGFRWSPTNEAWQRQLTANAIRDTTQVLNQIQNLN